MLFVVIGQSDLKALAARDPDTIHHMYETAAAQEVVHRRELLLAVLRERGVLALEHGSGSLSPVRGDQMNQFEAAMCFTWTAKDRTPL